MNRDDKHNNMVFALFKKFCFLIAFLLVTASVLFLWITNS